MLYIRVLDLLYPWLLFTGQAAAAVAETIAANDPVPGEQAPPEALDDYDSPYRPQIHWSPPVNFMNDPNGLFIDASGIWHLYYQFNPTGLTVGNQSWGHATSDDLYHWVPQKNAISPEGAPAQGLIFSGSAVRDVENTSGLFPAGDGADNVLAFYTTAETDYQTQDVAYSTDNGYTFTKYAKNPVLDYHNPDFRDPKVFWHSPTSKWVMTVAFSTVPLVAFFTSPDALTWTPASNFSVQGRVGVVFECPNLVELPVLEDPYAENKFDSDNIDETAWLLLFSIVAVPPLGVAINQYIPGNFNGTHFEAFDDDTRVSDWGIDNYAAQFWDGIPPNQGQIVIPWASNWQYTNELPTALAGFRGVFGVPRLTALAHTYGSNWTMISQPYPPPPSLYVNLDSSDPVSSDDVSAIGAIDTSITNATRNINISPTSVLPSSAFMLELRASALSRDTIGGEMNFSLIATSTSESLQGGYILGNRSNNYTGTVWLDRSGMKGFSSVNFTGRLSHAYQQDPGRDSIDMLIVIDRGMIEIFLDDGVGPSGTAVWFPSREAATTTGGVDLLQLSSRISGDGIVEAEVQGLKSVWHG